jgi:hypothetical protein
MPSDDDPSGQQRSAAQMVRDEDIIDVFLGSDEQFLSTAEVADELPISRRAVSNRLNELHEAEILESTSVGAGNIWWVPDDSIDDRAVEAFSEGAATSSTTVYWAVLTGALGRSDSRCDNVIYGAVLLMPVSAVLLGLFVVFELISHVLDLAALLGVVAVLAGIFAGGVAIIMFLSAGLLKVLLVGWSRVRARSYSRPVGDD